MDHFQTNSGLPPLSRRHFCNEYCSIYYGKMPRLFVTFHNWRLFSGSPQISLSHIFCHVDWCLNAPCLYCNYTKLETRDNTAATMWPSFRKCLIIALRLYSLWLLLLETEPFTFSCPWCSITVSHCRCRETKILSRAQLCKKNPILMNPMLALWCGQRVLPTGKGNRGYNMYSNINNCSFSI